MCSYRTHQQALNRILDMLAKGRFISRRQAASIFGCSEQTITVWLNELREDGHDIVYSRALQKYVLKKLDGNAHKK